MHDRPFARVLPPLIVKDIGRWLPWMLPEGQQDDFSKSFCALFWFWWFYWRACCSFFRSWWLFSIWFRGARAKSKKPSDVTFLILAILLTRIAFFGFGYCFQSDCFVVRAREASSLRQSSARSLKTTHTVYHEQSSFVSITTSVSYTHLTLPTICSV